MRTEGFYHDRLNGQAVVGPRVCRWHRLVVVSFRQTSIRPMARNLQCSLHDAFLEGVHELPKGMGKKVWKTLRFFSKDPRHPSLRRKSLHGKAGGLESIRVDDNHRIIFREYSDFILLLYVGTREKAYRFADRRISIPRPAVEKATRVLTDISPLPAATVPMTADDVGTLVVGTIKYLPLARFLLGVPKTRDSVEISFSQLERILGSRLPPAAERHQAWWWNPTPEKRKHRRVQALAWLSVGWETRMSKKNVAARIAVFQRQKPS